MDYQMIFIIASLVFGLAVIVGANIWALSAPPETGLQRTMSKEIDQLLRSEQGAQQAPARPPSSRQLSGGVSTARAATRWRATRSSSAHPVRALDRGIATVYWT